jgi:hypothetical protein
MTRALQEEGNMRVLVDNSEKLTTRRGLYCIWELASEGDQARLVARWIDPDAAVSEARDDTNSNSEEEEETLLLRGGG